MLDEKHVFNGLLHVCFCLHTFIRLVETVGGTVGGNTDGCGSWRRHGATRRGGGGEAKRSEEVLTSGGEAGGETGPSAGGADEEERSEAGLKSGEEAGGSTSPSTGAAAERNWGEGASDGEDEDAGGRCSWPLAGAPAEEKHSAAGLNSGEVTGGATKSTLELSTKKLQMLRSVVTIYVYFYFGV